MWSGTRYSRALLNYGKSLCRVWKHDFMSASFKCEGEWDNRLKSSLLQKVNLDNMFYEMDNKHNLTKTISAVDVDIFVNAVNDSSHIDEMEEIVHRLRMSSEATNIFPSTHHAFIRAYLNHGEPNELMRVLNDRLNYGIFPDSFCYILLMDYFLDKGDYRNAAKVAILQMLQEEFSNDLLKYMSVYSCYKYLYSPTEWEENTEESSEKDDGEEIKVRVKYLRNPYFDDHFDLRDPNSLIGKTLLMIGNDIDSPVKNDLILLGNSLCKKWKPAAALVNAAVKSKQPFTETTINLVKKIVSDEVDDSNKNDESYQELKNGLAALKNDDLVEKNILEFLEAKIKQEIPVGETIAQEQIKVYDEWENSRQTSLREEIDKLEKAKKLETIKKKKQELLDREQELYFFDHEDEIDLAIEKKKARLATLEKNKEEISGEYVSPEIIKKRSSSK